MDELTAWRLCANAIGEHAMMYLDTLMEGEVAALAESNALSLISQIREIAKITIISTTLFMIFLARAVLFFIL